MGKECFIVDASGLPVATSEILGKSRDPSGVNPRAST